MSSFFFVDTVISGRGRETECVCKLTFLAMGPFMNASFIWGSMSTILPDVLKMQYCCR